jgi:hypothetical protein
VCNSDLKGCDAFRLKLKADGATVWIHQACLVGAEGVLFEATPRAPPDARMPARIVTVPGLTRTADSWGGTEVPECALCATRIFDRATGITYLGGTGSAWAHEACVSGDRAKMLGVKTPLKEPLSVEEADVLLEALEDGAPGMQAGMGRISPGRRTPPLSAQRLFSGAAEQVLTSGGTASETPAKRSSPGSVTTPGSSSSRRPRLEAPELSEARSRAVYLDQQTESNERRGMQSRLGRGTPRGRSVTRERAAQAVGKARNPAGHGRKGKSPVGHLLSARASAGEGAGVGAAAGAMAAV